MTIRKITDEEREGWRLAVAGIPSGHHLASTLYDLYAATLKKHGREPVHPVRLGQILADYGAIRKTKWVKGEYTASNGRKLKGQMRKGWIL